MPSKKDMVRETKRSNREEIEIGTNKDASTSPSIIGRIVKKI
jgi:hypothetical protein